MPKSDSSIDASTKTSGKEEEIVLVNRIAHGDREALEEFCQRYYARLYNFIYYQVGGNQADAEDLLQITLLAAIDSLHTFQGRSRLYTWLCSIAWHKIADFRRRSRAVQMDPKNLALIKELQTIASVPLPDEILERQATQNLVHEVLLSLPEHYHRVLVLKYVEDFSVEEIAQLMGKSFKSIESLLSRARNAFRAALEGEEQDGR